MKFSKNQFQYTSKDYYKKIFLHRFRNFKSFKTQLDALNAEDPTIQYSYDGSMIPDGTGETFDFRHLLFDYFYDARTGADANAEIGIGFDFTEAELEDTESNPLPNVNVIEWIPFNDIMTNSYSNADDEDNAIFALKNNKHSLKTYPSFFNYYENGKSFNENWLKFFRVNSEAQIQIVSDYTSLTEPITEFYLYLSDLDNPFPVDVEGCRYVTTKKADANITNYDEVRSKSSGLNDYSEINFDDTSYNNSLGGTPKTVESVWQVKDIQGRKIIGICKSDDENNIIHERYTDGKLYAINIPSDNIYRDVTTDDIPTVEKLVIDLTNEVSVKGELMPPLSYYGKHSYGSIQLNRDGSFTNDEFNTLMNVTSTDYAKQQITTNIATYIATLTNDEKLDYLLNNYIGRVLVTGKTTIKAIPYDPTRAPFAAVADSDGYVPMDLIGQDLQTRITTFRSTKVASTENSTYPWSDGSIPFTLQWKLYKKVKIDTDWYAGRVKDATVYEEDGKWKLELQLETITLDEIKNNTSPLGWIYGPSKVANSLYKSYGESGTLSDYMTSFRFFDLSVMADYTRSSGLLMNQFRFSQSDVYGSHCATLSRDFFNNVHDFVNFQLENIVPVGYESERTNSDLFPIDDLQVYVGCYAGEALWQKGLEIIVDCNFTEISSFNTLFDDPTSSDYFEFNSIQRTLSEFDFTNQNLPMSAEVTAPYNKFNNTQDENYLIQPQHFMFIPIEWNQYREKKWLREVIYANDSTSTDLSELDSVTYKEIYDNFGCTIIYQEDNGNSDYVKDFVDGNFTQAITRYIDPSESITGNRDFYYLWRPVRHLISQINSSYSHDGEVFNHEYVYVNDVDETDKESYRLSVYTSVDIIEDPNALDLLYSKRQSTGTFYYELENSSIRLITPIHDLYSYTIINPSTKSPAYFFQPSDRVCVGFKGLFENKTSTEIISSTAEEITSNVSMTWNNPFRGILTQYNKNQKIIGDTAFHSAPVLTNDKGKNLLAPYGDMWIKLGDIENSSYRGGYTITNHNYVIPADWNLNGVVITGKQWKNEIDFTYTYNDPAVVHFFLTEDSDIRTSISITSVNNMRKHFDDSMLYLGSVVIPSEGYFNLNESLINLSETKENAFDIVKNTQLNELSVLETSLVEKQNENSRENLEGQIFSGYGYFTQMIQLDIESEDDRKMFASLTKGQVVSQNGLKIGEIMRKIDNLYTIVILLYSGQNTINKDVPIKFSIM